MEVNRVQIYMFELHATIRHSIISMRPDRSVFPLQSARHITMAIS